MDRTAEPSVVVIFGATGDLSRRKLAPALYNLHRDGLLPKRFAICAYGRRPMGDAEFRSYLREQLDEFSRQKPGTDWNDLQERIFYVHGEIDENAGYVRLRERLRIIDMQLNTGGNRLFYLAVGPELVVPIVENLGQSGLLAPPRPNEPWSRIVLEKPVGTDLASARELMTKVAGHAAEEQVFRIDHYLGKDTVQNILALRFGNCIFEPLWNRNYIEHVEISVAESVGVGTRAGYYDDTGALRDMVESHLLQLLCLVAMEAPGSMSANDIRNEKAKVLRNLRRMDAQQVEQHTVRGQYGPGDGGKMPGYRSEPGVRPDSTTETYAAVRCFVETWRWAGVPFLLRTGKRMPRRETEISIHFRQPPLRLFGYSLAKAPCHGNVLSFSIQPDEGISLEMTAKTPGSRMLLNSVLMDFTYSSAFHQDIPDAYERLLLDAINGDATLFKRWDEVEAQWTFIDAIRDGWRAMPAPKFPNYSANSWGPADALKLLPPCPLGWHLETKPAALSHGRVS